MNNIAIRVDNISKKYLIGDTSNGSLRQTLSSLFSKRKIQEMEEFWALRDISFEVKSGETVGIVGKNGAGKSTLLKILSRITEPTTGRIEIDGRVSSLLEVGTGFHSELTGRENVFLNGTILGMSRAEVKAKFDEIVDFSGVEKFLDTPVKRYSSGMKVRLAFAVAAHLEPEILIIDEVLAVGDAEFQKKCLGKMEDVAGHGRTILFVSHNMAAVSNLCSKCIYLNNGIVSQIGKTDEVIAEYLSLNNEMASRNLKIRNDREGNGMLRFTRLEVLGNESKIGQNAFLAGEPMKILLEYEALEEIKSDFRISLVFKTKHDAPLFTCDNKISGHQFQNLPQKGSLICQLPSIPLTVGEYSISLWCGDLVSTYDKFESLTKIKIQESDYFNSGYLPRKYKVGPVLVKHQWSLENNLIEI